MSTILAIEDAQDNFDLFEDALGETHELMHAETGQDGLIQARSRRPDLILLDMGLPKISGWEVARRLKADPALRGIPLIAVTAHAMRGDREKCLAVGCDDYMPTPVNVKELVESVEHYLEHCETLAPSQ